MTPTSTPTPGVATQFTISSLNVLGADHADPGGNKKGWAPGATRMRWLTQELMTQGVDVVGLQEFQYPQRPQRKGWPRPDGGRAPQRG